MNSSIITHAIEKVKLQEEELEKTVKSSAAKNIIAESGTDRPVTNEAETAILTSTGYIKEMIKGIFNFKT